jgi:hypothetical protein
MYSAVNFKNLSSGNAAGPKFYDILGAKNVKRSYKERQAFVEGCPAKLGSY